MGRFWNIISGYSRICIKPIYKRGNDSDATEAPTETPIPDPTTDKFDLRGGLENMAQMFFADLAQRYENTPNRIWEICKEPVSASWSVIKSYANNMIPIIRAHSDNIIIVGTPNWSQDVDASIK